MEREGDPMRKPWQILTAFVTGSILVAWGSWLVAEAFWGGVL